jgi:hypothetical protein
LINTADSGHSPEDGPGVICPYAQTLALQAQAWLPPPVQTTDIFSAQQTYPL